jgi:hypothetical protein
MLWHKKRSTTADISAHSANAEQSEAQQKFLTAIGM